MFSPPTSLLPLLTGWSVADQKRSCHFCAEAIGLPSTNADPRRQPGSRRKFCARNRCQERCQEVALERRILPHTNEGSIRLDSRISHPEREPLKESDEHAPQGRLDIWSVVGRNRG